jgi:mono/diheme cytochrome c family protein
MSPISPVPPGRLHAPRCLLTPSALCTLLLLAGWLSLTAGCGPAEPVPIANDEAMERALLAGKTPQQAAREWYYPRQIVDYFPGMDVVSLANQPREAYPDPLLDKVYATSLHGQRGVRAPAPAEAPDLSPNEILGRNTWMIWCAGNEGFWDWLASDSLGFIDLLKLVDSRQRLRRFADSGMINEPGMLPATAADPYGLWLDQPSDPRIRRWREAYLAQTFQSIAGGQHKTQIGLYRQTPRGTLPFFQGDLTSALSGSGYDPPSAYLPSYPSSASAPAAAGANSAYPDTQGAKGSVYAGGSGHADGGYDSAYDLTIPPPDIYGLSSGVIGLRLFPNPRFDAAASQRWNAERYYTDEKYYNDPALIRPYRVGMSCGFCHASFHPLNPPRDVTEPEWANLSGNIGAQYLSMRATVGNLLTPNQFVYHVLESQPRGTIDTSLIASDNINNPNTFNAFFNLPQRALVSFRNPSENQSQASARLPSLWANPAPDAEHPHPDNLATDDPLHASTLEDFRVWEGVLGAQELGDELRKSNSNPRWTPRVLLDGADSIGAYGALARVYLNIGSYYERWNQLHTPVLGLTPQKPFAIHDCETHSVYWHATTLRVGPMRDYFLRITASMPLLSTPAVTTVVPLPLDQGGFPLPATSVDASSEAAGKVSAEVKSAQPVASWSSIAKLVDVKQLQRGRAVFAKNCIVCHSSIQPESSEATFFPTADGRPPLTAEPHQSEPHQSEPHQSEQHQYAAKYQPLVAARLESRELQSQSGEFFDSDPGRWLRDPLYIEWALDAVERPGFWQWNYLSTDYRIPVTLVKTNSARALAINGMTGHMWEDFASLDYRRLPSPGPIEYFNPYDGESGAMSTYTPRHRTPAGAPEGGGGPGYYRIPSLVSVWATAPFLHNNSLGLYNNDPSEQGRLAAYDDAMRKLLWPELRAQSSSYNFATPERLERDQGLIWRTTEESWLVVRAKSVPQFARRVPGVQSLLDAFPWLTEIVPASLPAALLAIVSFVILSFSAHRRAVAVVLLGSAGLWCLWLALGAPTLGLAAIADWWWGRPLPAFAPWWLTPCLLALCGGLLLAPLTPRWTRRVGYSALGSGLVLGGLLIFNAGELGALRLGPIPAGTPVNLLTNLNPEADPQLLFTAIREATAGFAEIKSKQLSGEAAERVLRTRVAPALMKVNKCPDFVMDRGHYFEWFKTMSDEDKEAVLELAKTF